MMIGSIFGGDRPADPDAVAPPQALSGDAWLVKEGRRRRTYKTGSVHEQYEIGETLGKGTFAVVKEARHRVTGERVRSPHFEESMGIGRILLQESIL
jgi:serine/threonine protein kinase